MKVSRSTPAVSIHGDYRSLAILVIPVPQAPAGSFKCGTNTLTRTTKHRMRWNHASCYRSWLKPPCGKLYTCVPPAANAPVPVRRCIGCLAVLDVSLLDNTGAAYMALLSAAFVGCLPCCLRGMRCGSVIVRVVKKSCNQAATNTSQPPITPINILTAMLHATTVITMSSILRPFLISCLAHVLCFVMYK